MPGFTEWLIIGGVALLIWGPTKLPQLGGAIGKALRNFKTATAGTDDAEKGTESLKDKESEHPHV
ncbi:MAG: hypothetical protein A3F16_08610 [Deltaproteobacteria bacterium RIFCSPHIGHO2_12_FULL_43_9]|nr:MAG: hypothetical protein A3F16_08610 [Deltaproteobacteria bacterium RIFCSPHIGHO2_12_FULL_43_9]